MRLYAQNPPSPEYVPGIGGRAHSYYYTCRFHAYYVVIVESFDERRISVGVWPVAAASANATAGLNQ